MKLCDHIVPIYQNEIQKGNAPELVVVPSPKDSCASAKLAVLFANPLGVYPEQKELEEKTFVSPHSPHERYYQCNVCGCMISGPIREGQNCKYKRRSDQAVQKEVVATKDNVYVEDGFYEKFVVPVDKWKD